MLFVPGDFKWRHVSDGMVNRVQDWRSGGHRIKTNDVWILVPSPCVERDLKTVSPFNLI